MTDERLAEIEAEVLSWRPGFVVMVARELLAEVKRLRVELSEASRLEKLFELQEVAQKVLEEENARLRVALTHRCRDPECMRAICEPACVLREAALPEEYS